MSGSSGPTILPSSVPSRLSPSEGEIVRQRRRDSQHSRRANKLRYRRTALPSISEARPSAAPDMSQSIDFVVASTTATPYSLPGSYDPHYNRTVPSNYLPRYSILGCPALLRFANKHQLLKSVRKRCLRLWHEHERNQLVSTTTLALYQHADTASALMVLVNPLIDHGGTQQRLRSPRTPRRRSGWLSHDLDPNVGITDATDDNSRHSAIF